MFTKNFQRLRRYASSGDETYWLQEAVQTGVERKTPIIIREHVEPSDIEAVEHSLGRQEEIVLVQPPVKDGSFDLREMLNEGGLVSV